MGKKQKTISFFLAELTIGGVENVFITYANQLVRRGYKVNFIVCRAGGVLEKGLDKDVVLNCLNANRARQSFFKLRKYIKANKPSYIITGGDIINVMVVIAAMFTSTKVIITEHNYQDIEQQNQGWWSKIQLSLMKFFYPMADKVVAVSEGIYDYLINVVHTRQNNTFLLYNPIDLSELDEKGRQEKEIPIPENYIVFVGRISPVKNLNLLLDAYDKAQTDEAALVIVGDGPNMETVKSRWEKMAKKDKIHFTGMVSNPLPYIKDAKALVLCSLSEAFPTALLQAMAYNIPVVATPTPGAKEILAYREGTFISNSFDNAEEIACLIEKAFNCVNVDLRPHANRYEMDTILSQLELLLD